jgi:GGDEF domain-containing protein
MNTSSTAGGTGLSAAVLGSILGLLSSILGAAGALLLGWPGAFIAIILAALLSALALRLVGLAAPAAAAPVPAPEASPAPPRDEPLVLSPDRVDQLTQLANQNGLMAWFSERAPRHAEDKMSLVVLSAELGDFEPLVKSRGRAVADAVLVEVAKRVAVFSGKEGVAARTDLAGEFAALATVVPNNADEIAAEYAGKLAEMIQRPVELPTGTIWINGSVGAASGPAGEGEAILARARAARGRATRMGRGHYVVDGQSK